MNNVMLGPKTDFGLSLRRRVLLLFVASGVWILPFVGEIAEAKQKAKPAAQAKAPGKGAAGRTTSKAKQAAKKLEFGRAQINLPSSTKLATPTAPSRDTRAVKPPRSGDFLDGNTKEIAYEKLLDEEIKKYYELTRQYQRSKSRGELWLRLAERYVEKAQLVEFRAQAEYDQKLKNYLDKKRAIKPKVDLRVAREYNKKAIQLYEWFLRDFPKDKKIDQALFFLGYNHFEAGDVKKGETYYQTLVKDHSSSAYVIESHFALGEYYFENDKWQEAFDNYSKVIQKKKARLNTFAMYKAAWCMYRLNRVSNGLKLLERVVRLSRSAENNENVPGRKAVNKIRLAAEALKDYVPFYAETGNFKEAKNEFARVAQDESLTYKMLERLAYLYADAGNRNAANEVFTELIAHDPLAERAADFQYQIILTYATADQRRFREELVTWLEQFGPGSRWAEANAKNQQLLADTAKLQETTLRNHILQMHQAAQNSRAAFSQQQANAGYGLYMKHFPDSKQAAEMQFFHGELLFDMNRYEDAAKVYLWSAEKDPKGKYFEKSVTNAVLALEKDLPTEQQVAAKRGESIEEMPLDGEVLRFEKAAQKYFEAFPKGEKTSDIKRRLGVLYYSYNHFDKAMDIFENIIKDYPKSQNAEIAGNLLLDIYKIKGDMAGLQVRGNQLLANPNVANSKFGAEVRSMLESATYVAAQKSAEANEPEKSAKQFETFASTYKTSPLVVVARYNAGVNYEKAGDINSSLKMHGMVLASPAPDEKTKKLQNDSRNALARLYAQTGQLEQAARQYESHAKTNIKDQTAINGFFNAAVIWDGLGEYTNANRNYDAYMAHSRKPDRIETLFNQAEIARKRGHFSKAAQLYDTYVHSGPRSSANAIKSHFQFAEMSKRLNRPTKTREGYQRTIRTYQAYLTQGKPVGVQYAAEAKFFIAQDHIAELQRVRFGQSESNQMRSAADIKFLREKYIRDMKEVIRFDYGPMIVAALASTGQMFDLIAEKFSRIPTPSGYDAENQKKFKELIQQQIDGVRAEAKNSYKAAWDKSIELESYGTWSRIAAKGLAQYDSDLQYAGEVPSNAAAVDWMGL